MAILSTSFFIFKRIAAIHILLLITIIGNGQNPPVNQPSKNLPKAFSNLSDSISLDITGLTSLFSKKNGEKVLIALENKTVLEGVVQSVSAKYNNTLTTVAVKFAFPHSLLLTFSKIVEAPDTIIYRGLITGRNTGDCLELLQEKNQFKFIKRDINYLRAE